MKKKIVITLIAMSLSAAMVAGCSFSSEQEGTAGVSNEESAEKPGDTVEAERTETSETSEEPESGNLADTWTESDKQGVAGATGFEMTAPDQAEEISYSYMSESGAAQMSYVLDGAKWDYRIQPADELTDISGLELEWMDESEGNVAGMDAVYYGYADLDDDTADDVQLVNWYDAVTGVTYSLSASGTDLDDMDIQAYAENLYAPLQGDATDDPAGDRENELNDYFLGEHTRSDDGSSLTISDNGDGTFVINISITRLCSLENGTGTFEEHKMNFVIDDPNGEKLSGVIYRDSDNSLTVKITDSTWTYLSNDDVIEGFGK